MGCDIVRMLLEVTENEVRQNSMQKAQSDQCIYEFEGLTEPQTLYKIL